MFVLPSSEEVAIRLLRDTFLLHHICTIRLRTNRDTIESLARRNPQLLHSQLICNLHQLNTSCLCQRNKSLLISASVAASKATSSVVRTFFFSRRSRKVSGTERPLQRLVSIGSIVAIIIKQQFQAEGGWGLRYQQVKFLGPKFDREQAYYGTGLSNYARKCQTISRSSPGEKTVESERVPCD